jgi:hypothetical protein
MDGITAIFLCGDLTNKRLANRWIAPNHRLKATADTRPTELLAEDVPYLRHKNATLLPVTTRPTNRLTRKRPLRKVDVFVDDFVGMGQGTKRQLSDIRRTLLHSLDDVLRQLDELDDGHPKEPASVKKLLQGNAYWGTRKLVLGWVIDTILMTLELPQHRKERLHTLLQEILPTQQQISVQKWQQVLGEFPPPS